MCLILFSGSDRRIAAAAAIGEDIENLDHPHSRSLVAPLGRRLVTRPPRFYIAAPPVNTNSGGRWRQPLIWSV